MKRFKLAACFYIFSNIACVQASDINLEDIIQDPPGTIKPLEILECKNLNWYETAICTALAEKIELELNNQGLKLNNGDLMYTGLVKAMDLPTGHSCSHTAETYAGAFDFRLKKDFEIGMKIDSVDVPVILYTSLPVGVDALVKVKEEVGQMLFGKCMYLGSDRWNMRAIADVQTDHAFALILSPKFERLENGDYRISIKPRFRAESDIGNLDLSWDTSGKDPLFSLFAATVKTFSFITGVTEYLVVSPFDRDVSWVKYRDDAYTSAIGTLVSIDSVFLDDFIIDDILLKLDMVHDIANDKLHDLTRQVEDNVNEQIAIGLDLDANGEASYVISKDIVNAKLVSALIPVFHMTL